MKQIIQVQDVWKIYEMGDTQVKALRGLNVDVKKGEYLVIMGPSGSGKSTAMNMIGCLDKPTKGRILLNNKDISKMTESQLAQIRGRTIGFIFQNFNLINTLTAAENVMLPMIFQDIPEEQRRKKAKELLAAVDMDDRMDHRPTELSGGQQQRVAIARALATDPEVILADEPTGNLDTKTGKSVMEFLESLQREKGVTLIIVTHDPRIGDRAQRTVHLKDGVVDKEDTK